VPRRAGGQVRFLNEPIEKARITRLGEGTVARRAGGQVRFLNEPIERRSLLGLDTLFLSALPILAKSLGPNHQKVGSDQAELANLYVAINDYGRAEPLRDQYSSEKLRSHPKCFSGNVL
jgi:hypothetical protein